MAAERGTVPRGRHAPPLEVRLEVQRERLFEAAAAVFARSGYAEATAESISREAGMSKATFYEHFANKEECILALFDEAAAQVTHAMAAAGQERAYGSYDEHVAAGVRAFLDTLADHPEYAQTLLVEIIAAGPLAAQRRDQVLQAFADLLIRENAAAASRGLIARFASPHDAFAIVGAVAELISRQVRLGVPTDVVELAPVIDRLLSGVLASAAEDS